MARLPKGENAETIPLVPNKASLARTYNASVSATTAVTFNASTTMIEVTALTQPIMMKWGTTSASTSVFDHIIAAGTTRQFVVPPQSTSVATLFTAANFIEQAASATLVVTEL